MLGTSDLLDTIEDRTLLFLLAFCALYLVVHSDVFHEQILTRFAGATQGNYSTTWGSIIQMSTMAVGTVVVVALLNA